LKGEAEKNSETFHQKETFFCEPNEKPQTFYLRNFSRELRIENDVVGFCAGVVIPMKTARF
jgi:hypothetical protein